MKRFDHFSPPHAAAADGETMSAASLSEVHQVNFHGIIITTTVTSSSSTVDEWISKTYRLHTRKIRKLVVGLDTEWRLNSDPDGHQPVAVLQLCVGSRCLIFQFFHAGSIPLCLFHFLANTPSTFAGVGVEQDRDKLFEDWGLRVSRVMDVAKVVAKKFKDREMRREGLKKLMLFFTDKFMEKPKHITLSQWDAKELSFAQIEYACIDAYASYVLGLKFYDFFNHIYGKPLLIWHPHLEPYKDYYCSARRRHRRRHRHRWNENHHIVVN